LVFVSLGAAIGDVVGAGKAPDLNAIFHPNILLPIFGLAALALMPLAYKRFRPQK
jgi:hypothetical protein